MCTYNAFEPYSKLIAVTNRALCKRPFLEQIERALAVCPKALILREKDLDPHAYENLARNVIALCEEAGVPCFLHGSYTGVARVLSHSRIHMPFPMLKESMEAGARALEGFSELSVSCHSVEEVREAERLGATSIVLGTIFETDCKPGLQGAGLEFVREACRATSLPVFAIGGITLENLPDILEAGAAGGCMMSGFMRL